MHCTAQQCDQVIGKKYSQVMKKRKERDYYESCFKKNNVTIHGLIFPAQKKTTPLDRFYYRPDGAVFFIIHIQQIFLRQYMGYHHIILLMHHIR